MASLKCVQLLSSTVCSEPS